ncbi:hypothetical protein Syun_020973 [Stephania yunnanensis]|uniref:Uncharacterized protein n=1 Tax=Stephania yunnanensis TaxID=152371 RepID=A0AAP0NRW2_9MAGN
MISSVGIRKGRKMRLFLVGNKMPNRKGFNLFSSKPTMHDTKKTQKRERDDEVTASRCGRRQQTTRARADTAALWPARLQQANGSGARLRGTVRIEGCADRPVGQ